MAKEHRLQRRWGGAEMVENAGGAFPVDLLSYRLFLLGLKPSEVLLFGSLETQLWAVLRQNAYSVWYNSMCRTRSAQRLARLILRYSSLRGLARLCELG